MRSLPLLALSLLLSTPWTAFGQAYDIRVAPQEGVRVGVDIKTNLSGFRNLKIGGNTHSSDVKTKETISLVDRVVKLEEERILMTRKYVKWTRDDGGKVKDPEITGLSVAFEHDRVNDEHHLELVGDRKVRPETLEFLLAQSNSVGLILELPPAVPIARHFEIDFSGLLPLFLNGGGKQEKADFVLESFDPDARTGRLVGSLIAESVASDGVLEATTRYSGVCTIELSQKVRRITAITWEGVAHFTGGNESIEISGNADFSIVAKTKEGDSVEEAYRAEPEFRDVERMMSQIAVKCSLPSHWYPMPAPEGSKGFLFQSTLTGIKVDLELTTLESKNPTSLIRKIEEQIQAQYPAGTFASQKTTVGDGRLITFHEGGNRFSLALLPHGQSRLLQIRAIRSAEGDDPIGREFKTFLSTLTPLD